MRERPILFSSPMVRAILAGAKTQTRMPVKPQPESVCIRAATRFSGCEPVTDTPDGPAVLCKCNSDCNSSGGVWKTCPHGRPGDHLWVRETHIHNAAGWEQEQFGKVTYKADFDAAHPEMEGVAPGGHGNWNPSMYMPRWASRLTLEVTAVRVERVQDISGDDALAEGVSVELPHFMAFAGEYYNHDEIQQPARDAFRKLWDSINAKRGYGWDQNPWVWVVEFRRVEG